MYSSREYSRSTIKPTVYPRCTLDIKAGWNRKHRTVRLDLLAITATELLQLLARREVYSIDLVKCYLDQIDRHNHKGMELHAVISTAPKEDLFQQADALDRERAEGRIRGPMHGIPIIIKASQTPKATLHPYTV